MSNSHIPQSIPSDRPQPALPMAPIEGLALDELPVGAVIEVETGHHTYRIENLGCGDVMISGHPVYCPEPVRAEFYGSINGAGGIKMWSIVPGLRMEFRHPQFGPVQTSRVKAVREVKGLIPEAVH